MWVSTWSDVSIFFLFSKFYYIIHVFSLATWLHTHTSKVCLNAHLLQGLLHRLKCKGGKKPAYFQISAQRPYVDVVRWKHLLPLRSSNHQRLSVHRLIICLKKTHFTKQVPTDAWEATVLYESKLPETWGQTRRLNKRIKKIKRNSESSKGESSEHGHLWQNQHQAEAEPCGGLNRHRWAD